MKGDAPGSADARLTGLLSRFCVTWPAGCKNPFLLLQWAACHADLGDCLAPSAAVHEVIPNRRANAIPKETGQRVGSPAQVHVLADGCSSQRPMDREVALDRLRQVAPRIFGGSVT